MQPGLLVDSVDERRGGLGALLRQQDAANVELEALGELVLELELGAQSVRGGPDLGRDDALLEVGVLGLNIGVYRARARVAVAGDAERDS